MDIKLSSIASDIFGVSGIIIIEELMKGNRNTEDRIQKIIESCYKEEYDLLIPSV